MNLVVNQMIAVCKLFGYLTPTFHGFSLGYEAWVWNIWPHTSFILVLGINIWRQSLDTYCWCPNFLNMFVFSTSHPSGMQTKGHHQGFQLRHMPSAKVFFFCIISYNIAISMQLTHYHKDIMCNAHYLLF